jgi:hypothetical protein
MGSAQAFGDRRAAHCCPTLQRRTLPRDRGAAEERAPEVDERFVAILAPFGADREPAEPVEPGQGAGDPDRDAAACQRGAAPWEVVGIDDLIGSKLSQRRATDLEALPELERIRERLRTPGESR